MILKIKIVNCFGELWSFLMIIFIQMWKQFMMAHYLKKSFFYQVLKKSLTLNFENTEQQYICCIIHMYSQMSDVHVYNMRLICTFTLHVLDNILEEVSVRFVNVFVTEYIQKMEAGCMQFRPGAFLPQCAAQFNCFDILLYQPD